MSKCANKLARTRLNSTQTSACRTLSKISMVTLRSLHFLKLRCQRIWRKYVRKSLASTLLRKSENGRGTWTTPTTCCTDKRNRWTCLWCGPLQTQLTWLKERLLCTILKNWNKRRKRTRKKCKWNNKTLKRAIKPRKTKSPKKLRWRQKKSSSSSLTTKEPTQSPTWEREHLTLTLSTCGFSTR